MHVLILSFPPENKNISCGQLCLSNCPQKVTWKSFKQYGKIENRRQDSYYPVKSGVANNILKGGNINTVLHCCSLPFVFVWHVKNNIIISW